MDIYAVYTPNTYKITFDFGYNKTEAEQTIGEALSLPEVIERAGYTFVGWFTLANGEGEQLTDGASFMTDENVTYYAFYEPIAVTLPSEFPTAFVIVISAVLLLMSGGAVWFFIYNKKKKAEAEAQAAQMAANSQAAAEQKIVKTRYTDEEIEKIVAATAETHLLTNRELEVFCELLKGKKQSEIGYYLGISISTVKDNAGRIYGKLGVANKDELFIKIDSKLRKS